MRTPYLFRCREERVVITQALNEETSARRSPTPAQLFADAVWDSKLLKANEILVCLCYANHGYDNGRPVDRAWVTATRLMERTNLSKTAALAAKNGAIEKGWLVDVGHLPGNSQIRVYRFEQPVEQEADSTDRPARARNQKGLFAKKGATGPPDGPVPVHGVDRSVEEPQASGTAEEPGVQTGPQGRPVHEMDRDRSTAWTTTGPRDGPKSLTHSLADSLASQNPSSTKVEIADAGRQIVGQSFIGDDGTAEVLPFVACKPEPGSDDDPDWLKFWAVYPKKDAKQKARIHWADHIKAGVDPAVIIAGAEAYARLMRYEMRPKSKIKNPDGWLKDLRWTDENFVPADFESGTTELEVATATRRHTATRRQQELDEQQARRERQMARARQRSAGA